MQNSPKRSYAKYLMGGTGMAMLVAFAAPVAVQAQDAADEVTEVVVVGARAAQQSSNQRKKNAKTQTDSIVADDVGAFPDRNINEAISRIAGVALERGEFGEGTSINVRGNEAGLVRVELDGLGVGAGAGFAMMDTAATAGTGAGRASDLSTLPADLIKSVDVVKGSTADMSEGSLGGGVLIQTRTGLDFAKPYVSFRVGARRNSLGEQWKPDINFVGSRKFLDNRLGVVLSVTATSVQNNTNSQGVNNNDGGYQGRIDFDGSPEKTFAFNPSTVSGSTGLATTDADIVLANSFFTPRQIVERSAAAQTKDACYAAFPLFTTGANTQAQRNQRVYELQTCLNQWNDLEPGLIRSFDSTEYDDRLNADIRFDYRVNDRLTVYAKYAINNRKVDRHYRWRSLQGGQETPLNPGNIYTAAGNPLGVWQVDATGEVIPGVGTYASREVSPGGVGKYYRYDGLWGPYNNQPIFGIVAGIDPDSVKVDANHFVTEYVLTDAVSNITQAWEPFESESTYAQIGANYRGDNLRIDFVAGKSETEFWRQNISTNRSFNYGAARFYVQPSGLWAHEIYGDYDETNPNNYVQLNPQAAQTAAAATINAPARPAYTVSERPNVSTSFGLNYDAWLSETSETTAKLDVTYNLTGKVPFFTQFKTGLSYRNPEGKAWRTPSGLEIQSAQGTFGQPGYVAPIVLPNARIRSTFRACEPTATSIESCNYGYVPHTGLADVLGGVTTYTPSELIALIGGTTTQPDSNFFNDYEGAESLQNWQGIDVRKLMSLVPGAQNFNLNCIKSCVASDGNVYEQPYFGYSEKITAAYYMLEFEQELPLNLVFNGNFGLRAVETEVTGMGSLSLVSIRTVPGVFDPLDPAVANGITSTTYRQNVAITKTGRDYLPSYNLNLWVVPDQLVVRYYKAKTVARPNVGQLLPGGSCEIDERREIPGVVGFESPEDRCTARIGNPGLKPYTAWNQSVSVEWYPNRDTMFSFSAHKLDVRTGGVEGANAVGKLFEGTNYVDPVTGENISDRDFAYSTWRNAEGYERKGWEFTSKTAFTFLPWYLRYTGADFNYSKLESSGSRAIINPNTGDAMPPIGEPEYYANLSLWYDDGKTNARVSYQARAESFVEIEGYRSNPRNNYPYQGGINARPTPYQPGNPIYRDETAYVDAKITHKVTPSIELFLEGRNLTKEGFTTSTGGTRDFANGTPYINALTYGGRTVSFGVTYRQR
ncbi:MAG: TonB-dependent receptor [Asticcacaulis sp.]